MDKQRVMPILAGAVMAVSLTACQGMMGGKDSGQQTSSAQAAPSSAGQQQAMSSDLVRDIQRGLATRGYDVGPQDGVFGDSTEQALRKFQRDQRMSASGQVDAQTLAALGVVGGGQRATAGQTQQQYTPTARRQGAMAPQSGAQRVGLDQDQVRSVQQNLAQRGYDPGPVDGLWGQRTQAALRNFERDQDLRADGRPDPQTLAALGVEGGGPGTQTGQLPEDNPAPARERGELPPGGSQAPGSVPESERAPFTPGGAPDTANPPE